MWAVLVSCLEPTDFLALYGLVGTGRITDEGRHWTEVPVPFDKRRPRVRPDRVGQPDRRLRIFKPVIEGTTAHAETYEVTATGTAFVLIPGSATSTRAQVGEPGAASTPRATESNGPTARGYACRSHAGRQGVLRRAETASNKAELRVQGWHR